MSAHWPFHRRHGSRILVSLLLAAGLGRAAEVRDLGYFLRGLTDLDRLPLIEDGVTCKQFSGYDRASRILEQDKVGPAPQGMAGFGAGQWSGSNELFAPGQKDLSVTLELPVAKAGRFALAIYLTKAGDYGIVDVSLDGQKVGRPFDGFNAGVVPGGKVDYGVHDLSAGPHRLRFEVHSKNPGSSGYFMGIDCLTLTPAAP